MALKEKFFAMLAKLTADEKAQLKAALTDEAEAEEAVEATGGATTEGSATEVKANEAAAPVASDDNSETDEVDDDDSDVEADGENAEAVVSEDADEQSSVGEAVAEKSDESVDKEPTFQKGGVDSAMGAEPSVESASEEPQMSAEAAGEQLQDEQGDPIPVDYQDIIDGLNAQILALKSENKALKAKTEGAFGLSSRLGEIVKTNPLYDDDTSEIHFKK